MDITLDATPLLGRPTGVGRYVQGLVAGLSERDDVGRLGLAAFTVRGHRALVPLGRGVPVGPPSPARLLQAAWSRFERPPADAWTGRPEVFHATNYVLPPLRRAAGVVTVHDLAFLHHADTVTAAVLRYRQLVPRSVRRAEVVLTVSEAVRAELIGALEVDPARVLVAPPAVAAGWASAAPAGAAWLAARALPPRYAVFIGTREPRKDLATAVAAFERWHATDADALPLVLAGPAGWGSDPTAEDRPWLHHAGYLADAELQPLVAAAQVLLLPSRYEGFGLPVLEAFACGVAVIASDIPAVREAADGLATLVPAGDPDAWAHALGARRSPDPARLRARAAQFTPARLAEGCVAAYRQALAA